MKALLAILALLALPAAAQQARPLAVGSKSFTESVILGEMLRLALEEKGLAAQHRRALGGTRIVYGALARGEIDAYVDYTGTLLEEVFAGEPVADRAALAARLLDDGILLGPALGFANSYALAVRPETARAHDLRGISDLARRPGLKVGLSNEFLDRGDGWRALKSAYGLPQRADGLQHELAYRGIAEGRLDVIDVYTTDAEIPRYNLVLLADDRGFFPAYEAVLLYRRSLGDAARAALDRLEGSVDLAAMQRLNREVKIDGERDSAVAARFLRERAGLDVAAGEEAGRFERIGRRTAEHLLLVAVSLGAAILLALPLGILAARRRRTGAAILAAAGLLQTVPALAMFVFMIPLLGIGAAPTIAALFLYSLLPIVRNTHAGIVGIPGELQEAAAALGLPTGARLRRIELPLALPSLLAGIKTAAVINVGAATLGALIGAGGLGQPILTGIRLDNVGLIFEGAIPAALLALAVTALFDLIERRLTPRGLRLPSPAEPR